MSPTDSRCPTQVDLLGADRSDQGGQWVEEEHRDDAWVELHESVDRWILGCQAVELRRHGDEGRADGFFDRSVGGHVQGRHFDRARRLGGERDGLPVAETQGPHEGRAVPAVDAVVARSAERGKTGREVYRSGQLNADHRVTLKKKSRAFARLCVVTAFVQ